MKPRVMSLVLFTCMVGLLIPSNNYSFTSSIISLFAVAMGSGAAGALNMWYESDLDALMSRTCLRPIPTGKIKKSGIIFWYISIFSFNYITLLFFKFIIIRIISLYYWFLFFCLYNLVKEENSPKYCYWRSRGSIATCNRMDNYNRTNFS